jgi:hypothetical protein
MYGVGERRRYRSSPCQNAQAKHPLRGAPL